MPSPSTTDLPRPKSWDEFEDIVADILKVRWETPNVTRNGRSGQRQQGVDIYGRPRHLQGAYAGAQCKNLSEDLSWKTIEKEVHEAEAFQPRLGEFLIATAASRDAKLQEKVRLLNEQRIKDKMFPVEIVFWEDICLDLAGEKRLLAKHFPDWAKLTEDNRQPEIDLHWVVGEELTRVLVVQAPSSSLVDFESHLRPFSSREIAYMEKHSPEDALLAQRYNEGVAQVVADKDLKDAWLNYNAPERYESGTKCGIGVEVLGVEARDINIVLDFDRNIEVYEIGDSPKQGEQPVLPSRPKLASLSPMSRPGGLRLYDSIFPQSAFAKQIAWGGMPLLKAQFPFKGRWIDVSSHKVKIHVDRLAQRRVLNFSGDNEGILIVPRTRNGRFRVLWEADAVNLESPLTGELEIEVTALAVEDQGGPSLHEDDE